MSTKKNAKNEPKSIELYKVLNPKQPEKRVTVRSLKELKSNKKKITMLTAYDVVTASIIDQCGTDLILVGDSLGNVVLGHESTIPVELHEIESHTAAVVRGAKRAMVIADLPFGTTHSIDAALNASIRLFKSTNCQAVKIEGGLNAVPIVRALTENGIPVMAHIGLRPQSVHQMGGYYRHGKSSDDALKLLIEAKSLEKAGAFAIVLECVMEDVAMKISKAISIPTIGIGSGPDCDGQVLVINDLIGLSLRPPPSFAKARADVAGVIRNAVQSYIDEVTGPVKKVHSKK